MHEDARLGRGGAYISKMIWDREGEEGMQACSGIKVMVLPSAVVGGGVTVLLPVR